MKYNEGIEILYKGLKELDITITKKQEEQLIEFYEMLVEKNKVMNLTGITEFNEVVIKHFLDSLAIVKSVNKEKFNEQIDIIDVGTGAGFPGIPLKIVFPEINIVLLDSLNKRLVFLNEVIDKLGLHNISTIHGRSEDLAKKTEFREQFDLCVSRAVANMSTLCEFCIPFVKVGGCFVSYKAGDSSEEINNAEFAITKLGGKQKSQVEFVLPESELNRVFVNIEKVKSTPKAYPRKAGTPLKEPLSK